MNADDLSSQICESIKPPGVSPDADECSQNSSWKLVSFGITVAKRFSQTSLAFTNVTFCESNKPVHAARADVWRSTRANSSLEKDSRRIRV
jgi:hypothetical protein